MNMILQDIDAVWYMDDLVVTVDNDDRHMQNLAKLLGRLKNYDLKLQRSKSSFMQPSIQYLGLCVDVKGIHQNRNKVEAVTKVPTPKNVNLLQKFVGMIGYHGRSIPNVASKAKTSQRSPL